MVVSLIKYLKNAKASGFVFIGILTILVISALFGIISEDFNENPILSKNKYYAFFIGVLIAPFLETIIFQGIPFFLTRRCLKLRRKYCIFIFISPVLFIHNFNLSYILLSYIVGFVFAFMYYIAYFRKENAIVLISIIHLVNNSIAFFAHCLL